MLTNKTLRAAYKKRWDAANPEKLAAIQKRYYAANREKIAASNKHYRLANLPLYAAKTARRHAAKLQATPSWAEPELIELIYAEAAHRGMEVDHIIPLQGKTVCGLHIHNNMQLLSKSQNSAKRNRFEPMKLAA